MKHVFMGFLLAWSSAANGAEEAKFTNLKKGEVAPFDGRLFNDPAVSKLIVIVPLIGVIVLSSSSVNFISLAPTYQTLHKSNKYRPRHIARCNRILSNTHQQN